VAAEIIWRSKNANFIGRSARTVPAGVKEREEESSTSNGNSGIEVRKPV